MRYIHHVITKDFGDIPCDFELNGTDRYKQCFYVKVWIPCEGDLFFMYFGTVHYEWLSLLTTGIHNITQLNFSLKKKNYNNGRKKFEKRLEVVNNVRIMIVMYQYYSFMYFFPGKNYVFLKKRNIR